MANYYVKNGGNNALDGLSDENAWETIAKVNSSAGANSVYFKCGSTWREKLVLPGSGTEGNHIVIGSYGTGAKPRLLGSTAPTGWDQTDIPPDVALPANCWKATLAAAPSSDLVWFVNADGTVSWGTKQAALGDCSAEYEWYWHASGYLVVYAATDPDSRYTSIEVAVAALEPIITGTRNYITIQDLEIAFSEARGINADEWNTGLIQRCLIHHIGYQNAGTAEGIADSSVNLTITGNTIHNCGNHGIFVIGYDSTCNPTLITGNTVYDCYHTLIDVQASNTDIQNIVITKNILYTTADYSFPALGCNAIFVQWQNPKIVSNIEISYNLITSRFGAGIFISAGVGPGVTIYNNTVNGENALLGAGFYPCVISQTATAGAVTLKNNIFGNSQTAGLYANPIAGVTACDNNCYYNSVGTVYAQTQAGSYHSDDFAAYKTATGWETSGLWENPLFVTPGSDFMLQSGSPCVDAGADVGLTTDILGVAVPQGSAPDIGAYERAPEDLFLCVFWDM